MPRTDIIDISHYQNDPDWPTLKQQLAGVIFKATEGAGNGDPTFQRRRQVCIAQSIPHATYHFLRPGDVKAQLDNYLNTLKPRRGERVILDHEDPKFDLASLEKAVAYLRSDSRNLQITIYSGNVIKEQLQGVVASPILAECTSLWIAQYTGGQLPSWPTKVWPNWTLWQYTDRGTVPGVIGGTVDCNQFNGSRENAVKWLGPRDEGVQVQPPQQTDATPPVVTVTINAPKDVMVSVVLNGKPVGD